MFVELQGEFSLPWGVCALLNRVCAPLIAGQTHIRKQLQPLSRPPTTHPQVRVGLLHTRRVRWSMRSDLHGDAAFAALCALGRELLPVTNALLRLVRPIKRSNARLTRLLARAPPSHSHTRGRWTRWPPPPPTPLCLRTPRCAREAAKPSKGFRFRRCNARVADACCALPLLTHSTNKRRRRRRRPPPTLSPQVQALLNNPKVVELLHNEKVQHLLANENVHKVRCVAAAAAAAARAGRLLSARPPRRALSHTHTPPLSHTTQVLTNPALQSTLTSLKDPAVHSHVIDDVKKVMAGTLKPMDAVKDISKTLGVREREREGRGRRRQ